MSVYTDKKLRTLLTYYPFIQDNIDVFGFRMVENLCDIDRAMFSNVIDPEERFLLFMVYVNGDDRLNYTDRVSIAASRLDVSVSTVYRRLDNAIEKIIDHITYGEKNAFRIHSKL